VVLSVSDRKTRGNPKPWPPGTSLVAFPAATNATRLPSGATAMSTASTMPTIAGPLRMLPSGETIVTVGCTMLPHGSEPP
jgi:hypothetical protein